jgi:hypothetical protein
MKNLNRISILLLPLFLLMHVQTNAQEDAQEVAQEYGYICVYIDSPIDSALHSNSKNDTINEGLDSYLRIIINFEKSVKTASLRLIAHSETWKLDDTLKITKKPIEILLKKNCFDINPTFSVVIDNYYYDVPIIYGYEKYTFGPSDKIGIYNVHYWN